MAEWKNWKTLNKRNIKEDSHHSEIIDIGTGEVLQDTSVQSRWDYMEQYEVEYRNRMENYYREKVIHRNDIGDCFCSTDWSKH